MLINAQLLINVQLLINAHTDLKIFIDARAFNRQFTVLLKDFWLSSQPFEYSEYNAKGFSSSESEIGFPTWSLSRNMPGGQRFTALPSFLSCYSATADLTNKSLAYFGLQLNDHTFPAWKTILDHCLPQQPPQPNPKQALLFSSSTKKTSDDATRLRSLLGK